MLTRLGVSGFKNLVEVDISFGPFTCIAGANGVGKSNVFDAILFLSELADNPLLEAAQSVRGEGRAGDVRSLFHRVKDEHARQMRFEAEMIVPARGVDDLGQTATATITFLKYAVGLSYVEDDSLSSFGGLRLDYEELTHINVSDATTHLRFPHAPAWRRSAVQGKGRRGAPGTVPFISTVAPTAGSSETTTIRLHQDGGSSGRPRSFVAETLPRTVLSRAEAAESPTVLLARREMRSWRRLQLEPSALRKPDEFTAIPRIETNGAHVPATLARLARLRRRDSQASDESEKVFAATANRLSGLLDDVRSVRVDVDERRELFALQVTDRSGTTHEARSLSDGTLRFLALAVLASDPEYRGVLCFEEPENGFHPERIPTMIELLRDLAVDPEAPVGEDNPLRQVIVNTHSPIVVANVPDDSLVIAVPRSVVAEGGTRVSVASFRWLADTWREELHEGVPPVARGALAPFLNPLGEGSTEAPAGPGRRRRVKDRDDLQILLPFERPEIRE